MKPKMDVSNIPKTGRIGRFAKVVENNTTRDIYLKIMESSGEYEKSKPDKKALWWKNAIEKLGNELGADKATQIMRICGSKCCGQGQRKTAKKLMSESSSVIDFIDKINKYKVKEGELEYKLLNECTIIGKYNKCFCGQVNKSKELFNNRTYCQCSVEFNKQFFEAALEKKVEVELIQSIISGGDCCEFEIRIVN
jgi:hypothetical protein